MLSDEEKKAIKDCDTLFICLEDMMSEESANEYRKSYLTLTNLIEKQSKEIEEMEEVNKKFIAVDKIKEKIKEYYEYDKRMQNKPDWHTTKYYEAKALEKLLEE